MEFPNLWLMTRLPIGKYVGSCLTIWGALICVMAACHSFASLAAVRFLLGVFEAAILPCMMLLNSMWYRREEQPLRTAFWYNTFAGVFGGILSYAIGKIDGPLSTWRYIFLIYGAVTVLCGGLFILAMPDSPSKAWFFTAQEKELAVVRLASNQTGIDSKRVRKRLCNNPQSQSEKDQDHLDERLTQFLIIYSLSNCLRSGKQPETPNVTASGSAHWATP